MRVPLPPRLVLLALLTVACTITLPPQSNSPSAIPTTTQYATAETALRVLVEHQVDRPSSKTLLDGAVVDVTAYLKTRALPAPGGRPTFSGNTDDDLNAFTRWLDAVLLQGSGVTKPELERAAVNGMAKSVQECHTYYLDPDRAKTFNQPSNTPYSGIGARIQQTAPNTTALPAITQVFTNSPADRAGVRMGDRIKTVNGKDVAGLTAEEVATMIKGPEGTTVDLVVVRGTTEIPVQITRATLTAPEVVENLVPPGEGRFGYVGVSNITAAIPKQVTDSLGRLDQSGARGWILDLRSDPGGLLEPAEQVASTFIKSGTLIYEVDEKGEAKPIPVNPKAFYPRQKPLAVLVNQYTASGAEIIASAIQEHGAGRVFGQPTAGCISIALPRELPDGGLLLYTYAKIQSGVHREDLSGQGVTPDEIVAVTPADASDKTLDAAVAWLRTQATQ